jgi:hypothetical protein
MGAIRGAAIGMTLAVGLTSTTAFSADQEAMVMEEFTIPAADPKAYPVGSGHPHMWCEACKRVLARPLDMVGT